MLRIIRLVPECEMELLNSDDCAFAVAVASVIYGAETPDQAEQHKQLQQQQQPSPLGILRPLDMSKWCGERLCRKDREIFATRVLTFVQVRGSMELLSSTGLETGRESPRDALELV